LILSDNARIDIGPRISFNLAARKSAANSLSSTLVLIFAQI